MTVAPAGRMPYSDDDFQHYTHSHTPDLLHTLLRSQGHPMVEERSASTTIRAVVIDIGHLAGAHPSARQPLPGTKKVWQGLERLNWAVQVRDAPGEKQPE